jgi:hypothetical protein
MDADHDMRAPVRDAGGLTEILAAARDAFEWMLLVLEGHEDPAGAMFAPVVMAGAAAADGRDAVAFAPSCPAVAPRTSGGLSVVGEPSAAPDLSSDAGDAAVAVAAVCALLAARLADAASCAPDRGDQIACADAGRYATKIHQLLTGDGP